MNLNEIKEALDDAILHDCPVHHTYVKALWDQAEGMKKTLEKLGEGINGIGLSARECQHIALQTLQSLKGARNE